MVWRGRGGVHAFDKCEYFSRNVLRYIHLSIKKCQAISGIMEIAEGCFTYVISVTEVLLLRGQRLLLA